MFVNNPDVLTDNGVYCASITFHFLIYSLKVGVFIYNPSSQQGHNLMEYRQFRKLNEQHLIYDLLCLGYPIISATM